MKQRPKTLAAGAWLLALLVAACGSGDKAGDKEKKGTDVANHSDEAPPIVVHGDGPTKRTKDGRIIPPPWPMKIADFKLTDRNGKAVTPKDLRGKVWVAEFFFTSCAGICPLMTGQMEILHEKFKGEENFRLVSITVDPKRDTQDKLAKYAEQHKATPRWHFLRGTEDEVRAVAKSFKVVGDQSDPLNHTVRLILVDKNMKVRGMYKALSIGQTAINVINANMRNLRRDIQTLLEEEPAEKNEG